MGWSIIFPMNACRSGGSALVSFPLFQGIWLRAGSSELASSCMIDRTPRLQADQLAFNAEGLKFCPLLDKSGQKWILAGDGLSAYDPSATIHVISPSSNDALRHRRLAGAVAGWGLHPLENAALSRRTSNSDIRTATFTFSRIDLSQICHPKSCVCSRQFGSHLGNFGLRTIKLVNDRP